MRRFSVHTLKIGQNRPGRSAKGPVDPENLAFPDLRMPIHFTQSADFDMAVNFLRSARQRAPAAPQTDRPVHFDSSSTGRQSSRRPAGEPVQSSRSERLDACDGNPNTPRPSRGRTPRPAAARFPRNRPPCLRNSPGALAPATPSPSDPSVARAARNETRCVRSRLSSARSESRSTSTKGRYLESRGGSR